MPIFVRTFTQKIDKSMLVIPPTFDSEEELTALMVAFGLDVSAYGKGVAKSISDLLTEIRDGKRTVLA
jgi:hypothetical protein